MIPEKKDYLACLADLAPLDAKEKLATTELQEQLDPEDFL